MDKFLKKNILLTGTTNNEKLILLKKILPYDQNDFDIINDDEFFINNTHFYKDFSLNKLSFNLNDFKSIANKIKGSIICLENLNPRADTLIENIKILNNVFGSDRLKKDLILLFTFTEENSKSLDQIRNSVLDYNVLFKFLNIHVNTEKIEFLSTRLWLLEEIYKNELKEIIENIINQVNLNYEECNELSYRYKIIFEQIKSNQNNLISNHSSYNDELNKIQQDDKNEYSNIFVKVNDGKNNDDTKLNKFCCC